MTIKHGQVAIVEATVEEGSPVVGKSLADLTFPPNVVISALIRENSLILPKGDTILQPDDEVIALSNKESEEGLRQMLTGA